MFNSSIADSSWLSSWNIDVLLDSIKQLAPEINWVSVMVSLDQESFYFSDLKAFSILMLIHGKTCQDPFPIQTVCGSVWNNDEGRLSFSSFAVSAPPEVYTFAHSRVTNYNMQRIKPHRGRAHEGLHVYSTRQYNLQTSCG